ncbi:hypothetical protein [Lutibaculum baratangense]|uniref:Transmembrane protein n=1 Tax=Lutibaculum baratangense AMV1 TaxID=631454 RepID=V4TAI3_9HYPH|nr:hypothetical protein [Lutibaculum baratangense]ESR23438.1 hypothetical protein N177_3506 [Lutibaculum baratangense AMV1]
MFATWLWIAFVALWGIALIAFIPHVRRNRHPESRPVGAYLSFVTVFSVAAYLIFGAILAIATGVWPGMPLGNWLAAIIVLLIVFVPSFLLATAMIRRRPPKAPPLDDAPPHVVPTGREKRRNEER